jgi:hypothetical protein
MSPMSRLTQVSPNTYKLDLTSIEDRDALRELLTTAASEAPITMTVGTMTVGTMTAGTMTAGHAAAAPLDTAGAARPAQIAASYADAMRQVEATYYDTL